MIEVVVAVAEEEEEEGSVWDTLTVAVVEAFDGVVCSSTCPASRCSAPSTNSFSSQCLRYHAQQILTLCLEEDIFVILAVSITLSFCRTARCMVFEKVRVEVEVEV